jgi:hypothetical protein
LTSWSEAFVENARWEVRRLQRSRRGWLLIIPPIAGPIGSAVADLYLRIPSADTAMILGLLITGGLAGLILLDLTALAVGEDLGLRAHLTFFTLPQSRVALLSGRLTVIVAAGLGAYALGALEIVALGGRLIEPAASLPPIFSPDHLALAIPAFLLFLAGITSAAAVYSRTSAQALVAGVLAGVVAAGGTGYLLFQGELTLAFPAVLAAAGVGTIGWSLYQYPRIES